ncbi:MAG: FAD-containing oxidoreductase [Syntrophales bacterium]|nr:FAD-containing oxidoreductase [Syntrophales bacterium]MDD5640843.1 FAD-containing oxidoreductase [Syntrophales bacterium]
MDQQNNKNNASGSRNPATQPEPAAAPKRGGWWRPVLLLAVIITLLVAARLLGLGDKLGALREWIRSLGAWGPLVFMLLYIAATVAAIPGSAMTVAGGALFGSFWGVILTLNAAVIGASLAFLISRYFAREAMVRWLGHNEKFQRLDRLTEEHGAIIVALTRLVPIFPFNLLNYGFGLTKVPFWTYFFWSWLCMLPGSVLYVVGSDAVFQTVARGEVPWTLVGVLLVAIAVLTLLVRMARKKLQLKEIKTQAPGDDPAPAYREPEVTPRDQYNEALLANVHPPAWENPEPAPSYNLVVIGAGTAGLVSAAGAAGLGAKVALVERHLLGGDCLNYGCVPSKAIIRSSRVAADLREAGRYGVKVAGGAEVDFPSVMERLRRLRAGISHHDSARRFKELGIDVFLGNAKFSGPDTLEVAGKTLRFNKAVIATGGRAVQPQLEGLAAAGFLTNETVFSLTQRPPRLLVLGGGPIGCEFAQAFQRLGCQVSLLHKHERLMNREDADAVEIIQSAFLKDGIQLLLNANPLKVIKTETGKVVRYESHGQAGEIEVDEILVGAGRAPNVEGLNLEAAGVKYEGGRGRGIIVNDHLQTTNPNIYAAGDVCLPYQFTHLADATARIVIQNALFFGRKKLSALTIPWCTYTDPEVARVGLSEAEARKQGLAVNTFAKPLGEVDRAILDGEEEGFVKILVKAGTDKIVGATIVARHAGEMISEVSTAMAGKVGLGALAAVIHPYPTQAEAIRQTGDLYNRTRLTPFLKGLLARYLAWRR